MLQATAQQYLLEVLVQAAATFVSSASVVKSCVKIWHVATIVVCSLKWSAVKLAVVLGVAEAEAMYDIPRMNAAVTVAVPLLQRPPAAAMHVNFSTQQTAAEATKLATATTRQLAGFDQVVDWRACRRSLSQTACKPLLLRSHIAKGGCT
jgi:hypothetical protein